MPAIPTQLAFGNANQYPARTSGQLGQHGFFVPLAFQVGTGGMPAVGRITASGGTVTGIIAKTEYPGFGVTLVGTALYNISLPNAPWTTVLADVAAPSGRAFDAKRQYNRGDSASGLVKLGTFETVVSGQRIPAAAPTGSVVDMLVYVNSRNDAGLTRF